MDWKSTRTLVCMAGMACTQWGLVARLISAEVWMAVMMTCLGGFGLTKVVEYAKSGRKPDAVPCEPEPSDTPRPIAP